MLSHFSLDLVLNSYIVTQQAPHCTDGAGLIPIASDTPSYSAMPREFGLEKFLFDSPAQLDRIIRNLDPEKDLEAVKASEIVETLWARFLPVSQLKISSTSSRSFDQTAPELANVRPQMISPPPPRTELYFTEHLKHLLPSLKRAIRRRSSP